MRCLTCKNFNYDYLSKSYVLGSSFCGVHGRCSVDPSPSSPQVNLDRRGSCDYHPKSLFVELSFNFDYE